MTREQAFEKLLADRERCLEIGMTYDNYYVIKHRFTNTPHLISIQKIENYLKLAGYVKKESWKIKTH